MVDLVLLGVGLTLLVAGGRAFVDGASRLAESLGFSQVLIGLTVVAFGTSAPEFALNVLAATRGNASIAFGNVIGSNVANVALVLGLCALVRPLTFESQIVWREIPMMLLATAAALVLGLDRIRGGQEVYDVADGLMLLLLFGVFLYYLLSDLLRGPESDPLADAAVSRPLVLPERGAAWAIALAAAGLAALLGGAELTIRNAVAVAEALDLPRAAIGISIVAVGTSLPELTTSLVATWKGQTSLAVGNVVGSNVFNLLFVLGSTATIQDVEVPPSAGVVDLLVMAAFASILFPLAHLHRTGMARWNGAALLLAYVGYLVWRLGG